MTDFIKIERDDTAFQAAANRLRDLGTNLSPLMADIAEGLYHSTQDRFTTKIAPDGTPWASLKLSTIMKRGPAGGVLVHTSNLSRDGIHHTWGADFAEVAAIPPYARWHQEGTDPYVILPKNKKALGFISIGGVKIARKKVNHPGLPARTFMGISDDDRQMIDSKAAKAIERATKSWLTVRNLPTPCAAL